jgi:hypothetical protein
MNAEDPLMQPSEAKAEICQTLRTFRATLYRYIQTGNETSNPQYAKLILNQCSKGHFFKKWPLLRRYGQEGLILLSWLIKIAAMGSSLLNAPPIDRHVQAGWLVVAGNGTGTYTLWKGGQWLGKMSTNTEYELLPGHYAIQCNQQELTVQVRAGKKTTVNST